MAMVMLDRYESSKHYVVGIDFIYCWLLVVMHLILCGLLQT